MSQIEEMIEDLLKEQTDETVLKLLFILKVQNEKIEQLEGKARKTSYDGLSVL